MEDDYATALEDFDAAFDELARAAEGDDTATRRSLRAVLACLYELREAKRRSASNDDVYFAQATQTTAGNVAEGVCWMRGKMVHLLTNQVAPAQRPLYPSDDLYPSDHVYPGSNLTWRTVDEIDPHLSSSRERNPMGREQFRRHVAGQVVLPSLLEARNFLASAAEAGSPAQPVDEVDVHPAGSFCTSPGRSYITTGAGIWPRGAGGKEVDDLGVQPFEVSGPGDWPALATVAPRVPSQGPGWGEPRQWHPLLSEREQDRRPADARFAVGMGEV